MVDWPVIAVCHTIPYHNIPYTFVYICLRQIVKEFDTYVHTSMHNIA